MELGDGQEKHVRQVPGVRALRMQHIGEQGQRTQEDRAEERSAGIVVVRPVVIGVAHVEPTHESHHQTGGQKYGGSQSAIV